MCPHALENLLAVDHFERELDLGWARQKSPISRVAKYFAVVIIASLQAAALETLHLRQLHAEQVEPLQHVPARRGDRPARLGEKELLAGLFVQRQAKPLRQLLDLDGERRRRHMHLLRRPRHVEVARERGEEAQLMKRDLPEQCFMILNSIL